MQRTTGAVLLTLEAALDRSKSAPAAAEATQRIAVLSMVLEMAARRRGKPALAEIAEQAGRVDLGLELAQARCDPKTPPIRVAATAATPIFPVGCGRFPVGHH